jgi:hypothetical protein
MKLPPKNARLQKGDSISFHFGERDITISRPNDALWIFEFRNSALPSNAPPVSVLRYATNGAHDSVEITPMGILPPLLVKFADGGVNVLAGDSCEVGFLAPIALRINFPGQAQTPLFDDYCRPLMKAWAGTNLAGREAREWKATLLWEGVPGPAPDPDSDLIYCSIAIRNESNETLKFDRLAVELRHSPLFLHNDRLHSGLIRFTHKGGGRGSEATYSREAPGHARGAQVAFPARNPQDSVLHAIGLQSLITGTGQ